tara:strand:- start:14260 stop:15831 length:1572 start_codon:yes stop_codon:yes gene_type:complete
MAITKVINVDVNTGDASQELNKLEGSFKEVDKAAAKTNKSVDDVAGNGGAIAILDQLTGGLATRFKDAFEASKLFNGSLKAMRGALIATGIGALVVGLALVVAYWDDIVGYITDANGKLENQLALTESISGVLDSQLATVNKQLELNKLQGKGNEQLEKQKLAILLRLREQNEASTKILENQLERLKATSTEVGFWDNIKANVLFTLFGTKVLASEAKNLADQRLKEINDLDISIEKSKLKEIDLATQLYNIENPEAGDASKEPTRDTNEDVVAEVETDLIDFEAIARAKAEKIQEIEDFYFLKGLEREISEIERKTDADIAELERIGAQKSLIEAIEQDSADRIAEIVKAASDKTAKVQSKNELTWADVTAEQKLQIASASLNVIGSLVDRQSAAGKGIAAAQAGINTFKGITSALSQPTPPPFNIAMAALVGASGLISVGKILSEKIPSATGRGFVSGSGGVSGGTPPPTPSFNLVEGTENQQINDSINLTNTTPTRAFVVSGDVTTAQSEDRNIVTESGI